MRAVVTILVLLALGVLVQRWPGRPAGLADGLAWFVVRIAFPARIITLVPEIEADQTAIVPVAVAWGVMALVMVVLAVAARLLGWSRRTLGTLLVVVPFGNTAFLGFPVVETLLGADHLGYALLYDQLGTFLGLATVGSLVLATYGHGDAPTVTSVLRRTVTFPPFVALVAGFLLVLADLPAAVADPLATVIGLLGATLVPLAIVAIGMRLRVPRGLADLGPLAVGIGTRVVLAPVAVLTVVVALGLDGPAWSTSVVQAGMSSGVVAAMLAADNGLDGELAANLSGLGVPFAAVLAPVWVQFL